MLAAEKTLDSALLQQVTEFRHDLHQHPELGYREVRTSAKVREWLKALDVHFVADLAGGTGVLAYLPATKDPDQAPTVALRADMDALPILEDTGLPYSSANEGVMHACGHDGHTSVLCGAVAALKSTPERPNNLLFIFQPAEEGGAGGRRMVEDGVLTGKLVGKPADVIFGLHGYNRLKLGEVCTCDGAMLASTDEISISVVGKGGHAALPNSGVDPTVIAAQILIGLQTIVSRNVDPLDSMVISMPMMHGGPAHNVIPDRVELTGTMRTLLAETRTLGLRRIREVAEGIATAHGARAEVTFGKDGYPVTRNNPEAAARFRRVMRQTEGLELVPDTMPVMGGEDFSFYGASGVPACFYWLGLKDREEQQYPNLHAPKFDFNDKAIPFGIQAMVALALSGR